MNPEQLRELARKIAAGAIGVEEFVTAAMEWRTAELGDACVDLDRRRRCGFPEVVFGEGKSSDQLRRILTVLVADGGDALATRVSAEKAAALAEHFPEARYNPVARTLRVPSPAATKTPTERRGRVVIVTAGTSDLPVAEEARETALWMGAEVELIQDVGVAGPQRLLAHLPTLRGAAAVVVVAGMEAALTGVVGGHVDCPVIGVPTSIGYGASLGGFTALFGMLSCCAANVTVVNIDAGFKGGYVAALMAGKVRGDGA
jgi:NCAIR mutase (PurE)-related protein